MFRKPYFLAKTPGSMELVWKKKKWPSIPYNTRVCCFVSDLFHISLHSLHFRMIFWGKRVMYLILGFVVKYPVQSFSTFEMFWSANQNQQLPNHGANLASHAWGSFSWQSIHKEQRIVKHTRGKKLRCERKLWSLSLLTGMNRLQEKRNVSLISVCMG